MNNSLRKRFWKKCQEGKVVSYEISYKATTRILVQTSYKSEKFPFNERKINIICYLILVFLLYLVRITFLQIDKRINLFWAISLLGGEPTLPPSSSFTNPSCVLKWNTVVSSLTPAPKRTSKNLNYFKTYASKLPFTHSIPPHHSFLCQELHPSLSYYI